MPSPAFALPILDEVTEEMFYDEANRIIFKTMKSLHINNIPVDVQTVCNELDKTKSLSKVGGVEYITKVIDLKKLLSYAKTGLSDIYL